MHCKSKNLQSFQRFTRRNVGRCALSFGCSVWARILISSCKDLCGVATLSQLVWQNVKFDSGKSTKYAETYVGFCWPLKLSWVSSVSGFRQVSEKAVVRVRGYQSPVLRLLFHGCSRLQRQSWKRCQHADIKISCRWYEIVIWWFPRGPHTTSNLVCIVSTSGAHTCSLFERDASKHFMLYLLLKTKSILLRSFHQKEARWRAREQAT